MTTNKANGGGANVWERAGHNNDATPNTLRVVLCRNGCVRLVDDHGHRIPRPRRGNPRHHGRGRPVLLTPFENALRCDCRTSHSAVFGCRRSGARVILQPLPLRT